MAMDSKLMEISRRTINDLKRQVHNINKAADCSIIAVD